ncbi:hypothetical protein HK104_004581 [Borealophlyctis nickersoniae]|nr:hypothetical protein HK104_004581 [Borealophlyctis nickersoniae]
MAIPIAHLPHPPLLHAHSPNLRTPTPFFQMPHHHAPPSPQFSRFDPSVCHPVFAGTPTHHHHHYPSPPPPPQQQQQPVSMSYGGGHGSPSAAVVHPAFAGYGGRGPYTAPPIHMRPRL